MSSKTSKQSHSELYRKSRRMKILLAIAASLCLFHLAASSPAPAEPQTIPSTADTRPNVSLTDEEQITATSQRPLSSINVPAATTTEAPINADNKPTTITIFKIQKQALLNHSNSNNISADERTTWLLDKADQVQPMAGRVADELGHPSAPAPAPASSSSATGSPTSTSSASPSRAPPVLRPSIEEVASKLSRKHLNLEHDNWRVKQATSPFSTSLPTSSLRVEDSATKLADGSPAPSTIEAEQDIVQTAPSLPEADRSSAKLSESHHRDQYLHIDAATPVVMSGFGADTVASQPKIRPTSSGGAGRRKKNNIYAGETYEILQCHHYLRIYHSSSAGASSNLGSPTGLYQMISNQQLPCSCEMRSQVFSANLSSRQDDINTLTSWLSCDHVQLIGGYFPSQGSNSSADSWEMGKLSINANVAEGGPVQVSRFSQRNSGLQTLHAQKFLNLQLSNLRSIDLSSNRIRQIKVDAFHGLELVLEHLNLANNLLGDSRAVSYDPAPAPPPQQQQQQQLNHQTKGKLIFFTDELNRLKKLKWLSLRNNRINQLSPSIFSKSLASLASFTIQQDSTTRDKLTSDETIASKTNSELIYLDLSENLLKTVPSEAIVSLDTLQTLDLRGNKIVQLDEQSKFPKSLRHLDLSENLIKTIRNCDLIDLPDLIELNLSHNQLSQLDKTAFLSSAPLSLPASSLQLTLHETNLDPATGTTNGKGSLSSLPLSDNLIIVGQASSMVPHAGQQSLAPGNNDEQIRPLSDGLSEPGKSLSSLHLDHRQVDDGPLGSQDLNNGEQRPKVRSRRDVVSDESTAIIMDAEDDLDAEESDMKNTFAAMKMNTNERQQTLADDLAANSRMLREFNSTIKLNLAYNHFTDLPGDLLLKFPNLQQLDLSYNRIRALDSNYLCSVYNLVESLRELDLRGNLLVLPQTNNSASSSPATETTAPTKEPLVTTVASGRQLNKLFGCLQKLERLSLATNRLSSQSIGQARQKPPKTVELNEESPSEVEEEEEDFSARSTSSGSPERLHIKFGDNYGSRFLSQLDLSDNQLKSMPIIEQVFQQPTTLLTRKTNGSLVMGPEDDQQQRLLNQWMASRVYLMSLDLSYNYIDRLEERNFDHLFSLRHLSFDYNRLTSLPGRLMRKFTSLDGASFEGNRLSSLEPLNELFERSLRTLRSLNLANNRLTEWPAISKALYENPIRPEYLQSSSSIQVDFEDKQAAVLQFALEELNLEGNLLTSNNLSSLFDQLAHMKSLKSLNLSQNLLNRVRSEWFKFANDNLRILSMAGNKINSIDLGSFAYNQSNQLQHLDLSENLLKELKRKTFDSLPRLKQLNLSHNFIHTINSEAFNQMQAMQVLDLSNNKLTSWKCEYFSNLCNSISGNINADLNALLSIMKLPNEVADRQLPVSSLIELNLSRNSLSQLRVNSISVHTKLERLDLSHNKLSYIPHDLFRATISDSRTGRQIQLVSSLRQLNLAHNRIQTVDNINLRPLRNLIGFDLSHNELQTLGLDAILIDSNNNNNEGKSQRELSILMRSNITNLLLDNGNHTLDDATSQSARQSRMLQQRQQVTGSSFPALGKLRHLNLSNNQLTQVNQSLLHELSPFVLLNLDLSHNYLESESLPYGFYAKVHGPYAKQTDSKSANYDLVFTLKLESLNLSHNRLSEFPANLLENHHISMESCNLSHNRIQSLPPNTNILIQIKWLNLEFNPLNRESNELILSEHKSVRQLNLAATRLYAIKEVTQSLGQPISVDKHLSAHKHRLLANQTSQLDLIRSISKPIEAPYLQHLNLSSNQLVWLAANIFERMHSLQTLDLSNNQLTRLHLLTNQLSPLSASLNNLNLASNLFTNIDATDFSQLTRLQHLDLSSLLSLQKLNCRFLSKLTTLRSLRLFNFPQVRQQLANILVNLQQRHLHDSHALNSDRIRRKLQQELLMSTVGRHCFSDEPADDDHPPPPHHHHHHERDNLRWLNLRELQLELFSAINIEDSSQLAGGKTGFQLNTELTQLIGPETSRITLFGLNLTSIHENSLLGVTSSHLQLKISYTSLARLPLEQVLNGISKRTKLALDFRNNNIQSLDVRSLQILDELQLNNQILQRGDHSSLRLASNPVRCDCQTRPLWLWLNQRWAGPQLWSANQAAGSGADELAADFATSGGPSATTNNWHKISSVSATSDIKCQYPVRLRGKLAQYVNYNDLVCKGSSSNQLASRQSRKRNETKPELSYYSRDFGSSGDFEDDDSPISSSSSSSDISSASDYYDSPDATDGTTSATGAATQVRVTRFNRFPSLMYNQTIYYLEHIPVPFIVDNQQPRDERPGLAEPDSADVELDSTGASRSGRMGKRDGNSVNSMPIYPILADRQTISTKYSKHRPNTQQRHAAFDTLTTLKQFQPTHHHSSGQKQTLLTDLDIYILTIMSIAMSIMSLVIIAICLFKYKMDRSDKERILTDHGKMLMSQAIFNINQSHQFGHQPFKTKKHSASGSSSANSGSSKNTSAKKSSKSNSSGESSGSKSSGSSGSSGSSNNNKRDNSRSVKRTTMAYQAKLPVVTAAHRSEPMKEPILVPLQLRDVSPASIVVPASAQNFLMRSPTVRRMQGLATNASDWFKYTLRAYPSNAALHRGQRRRRLFLGDTVPVASQLSTGKRDLEEQLSAAHEPGSPATLAVGCPQHAFRALDKLRQVCKDKAAPSGGIIEEKCLHCARLLAAVQQTKVQYLVGKKEQQQGKLKQDEHKEDFMPPSLIRALAEQLDQANAESNYVALRPGWLEQQQVQAQQELGAGEPSSYYKREQRLVRPMKTFGALSKRQEDQSKAGLISHPSAISDGKPREGSQIPSVDVIGRFAYQSDSQLDTPTPYDARNSSILGGSSQMDGSEDTNGLYNRDGVFVLVPDDTSDGEDGEPTSVLLNRGQLAAGAKLRHDTTLASDDADSRFTDQQEESIKMQDECSRSSSPVAYGFMQNSGPSSLASSSAARSAQEHHPSRYQRYHQHNQYFQPAAFRGQCNPSSDSQGNSSNNANANNNNNNNANNNNNNNNINSNSNNNHIDHFSPAKKVQEAGEGLTDAAVSNDDKQQQVIISRL